jgi:hypothetical protein
VSDWIEKTAKYSVHFDDTPPHNPFAVLKSFATIGGVVTVLFFARRYLIKLREQSMLIVLVGLAAYTFCVSGGMYNIIQKTEWTGKGDNGEISR